jgi:hypothetical protein
MSLVRSGTDVFGPDIDLLGWLMGLEPTTTGITIPVEIEHWRGRQGR